MIWSKTKLYNNNKLLFKTFLSNSKYLLPVHSNNNIIYYFRQNQSSKTKKSAVGNNREVIFFFGKVNIYFLENMR